VNYTARKWDQEKYFLAVNMEVTFLNSFLLLAARIKRPTLIFSCFNKGLSNALRVFGILMNLRGGWKEFQGQGSSLLS
jgi:hypothetical protein